MDWVTLETFWSVEEAQLALGFLEVEGIPCQLEGVAVVGNLWHLANATGGVKLQVAREEAERAAALLTAVQHHREGDPSSDTESDAEPLPGDPDSAGVKDGGEYEEDNVDRDSTPASEDWDDDGDRPGLFDRFRQQKTLIILLLVLPTLIGVILGVMSVIMVLVSKVAGVR